jgi:hypothetical protein
MVAHQAGCTSPIPPTVARLVCRPRQRPEARWLPAEWLAGDVKLSTETWAGRGYRVFATHELSEIQLQ